MNFLYKDIVLVLNKNWQAINVRTPADALASMYTGSSTGLDVKGEDNMVPLKWNEWVNLPVGESDLYVSTIKGKIKIPKIIILSNYNKIPKKRPNFTMNGVWNRDNGICQYTGKKLKPNEGNIDHIVPKSRGGKSDWNNCVLSHKDINAFKANRTPEEVGLKLIKTPKNPVAMPVSFYIKNTHQIKEWDIFLKYD
jgi:hypothetical protein